MFKFMGRILLPLMIAVPGLAGVELGHGYVRAMPPGQTMTAAYIRVSNSGDQDVLITAVRSSIAAKVEIHESVERDGMLSMRQLPSLLVRAGGTLQLVPGGTHLMFFNVGERLIEGDQVAVSLEYDDGSSQQFSLPVTRGQTK